MKRIYILAGLLIVLSGILSVSSCKWDNIHEAPAACIGSNLDTVYVSSPLIFESCNQSSRFCTYVWNLGDGTIDTNFYAQHAYTTPNIYHCSFTIINKGKTSTKDFTIVAVNNPAGTFTFESLTILPTACYITNGNVVNAANTQHDTVDHLEIIFANSIPTASGIYTVAPYGSTLLPGQVSIWHAPNPATVWPDVSIKTNSTETIQVLVLPNGKLNLTGSGIELSDRYYYGTPDTNQLSFNLTQTQ